MKKAVFVILQSLLLLASYFAGAVLAALHKLPDWSMATNAGQSRFSWDGLVFLGIAFLLILAVQAARKVLQARWLNPVVALVLTLLFLAATKFPMSSSTPMGPGGM